MTEGLAGCSVFFSFYVIVVKIIFPGFLDEDLGDPESDPDPRFGFFVSSTGSGSLYWVNIWVLICSFLTELTEGLGMGLTHGEARKVRRSRSNLFSTWMSDMSLVSGT